MNLLESTTTTVEVNGILKDATLLLQRKNSTFFQAPMGAVIPRFMGLEKCLLQDPKSSATYETKMKKL